MPETITYALAAEAAVGMLLVLARARRAGQVGALRRTLTRNGIQACALKRSPGRPNAVLGHCPGLNVALDAAQVLARHDHVRGVEVIDAGQPATLLVTLT